MKSLKTVTLLLICIFLVTGCGSKSKTLECTTSQDITGAKMNQTITVKFKDEKIDNVKANITVSEPSEELKNEWNQMVELLKLQYPEVNETGFKMNSKNDSANYKYVIEYEIDVNKASKETLNTYGLDSIVDSTKTYDEIKSASEANGATCK